MYYMTLTSYIVYVDFRQFSYSAHSGNGRAWQQWHEHKLNAHIFFGWHDETGLLQLKLFLTPASAQVQ